MKKLSSDESKLYPNGRFFDDLYFDLPRSGMPVPMVIFENMELIADNLTELLNWGIFLNSCFGHGIQAWVRTAGGQLSYPPVYMKGADLMFLDGSYIDFIHSYDLHRLTVVGILDEATGSFHLVRIYIPEESEIPVYKPIGVDYKPDYTLEMDKQELLRASDIDFLKSKLAYEQSNYQKSINYLERLLKRNPYYSRAYTARGVNYLMYQDRVFALANYFDGLEINPGNWRSYYNIGLLLKGQGFSKLASKYYETCLEINPDFQDAETSLQDLQMIGLCVDTALVGIS